MKTHTSDFKNKIKEFGREIDSKITYTIDGTTTELGNEQLNSVTPHYEGGILKSVMKQLDIDSNVEIPVGTILTYQFGVKVGNSYEYISYGNYVVKEVEKQEDTMSYKITCYDKMLYSMIPYEAMSITYPITIRNYISAICTKLGLTFKNSNSTFANYNKQITKELYLDSNGKDLGYTFRDVLDELAQVTASTICINEIDDELEIRYINDTNDTIDEEFLKDVNVNFGEKFGAVNTIVLSRSAGADNIYYPSTLPANPVEIKISDNQIMNGNDRDTYMEDIYNKLNGLEYYINDFSSTGICYYNLCDKYNVSIGGTTYSCIMFNDEVNVTQGLQESIYTDMPEESVTDYTKADKTDRRINQTTLIVDKQQGEINALVDTTEELQKEVNPTDTATGSSIYLEDSTDAELVNFELEGKTTQETSILPSEYTQVDYITLTGTQYLNTNYKLWNSTTWKIELDFSISENYNYNAIFGFDDITDTNNEVWIYSTSAYAWRACGNSNTNVTSITPDERIVMTHDNNSTGFRIDKNGTNVWNTTQLTGTADHNLCVGHRQGGGWLKGKIYSIKMYSNSAMVRNFIPCYRNSDSVVGLYDLVNDTFYTNSGTGTFAYGNVVNIPNPEFPSELVSVGYQNLFDKDSITLNTTLNASGQPVGNTGSVLSDFIKVTPNTSYYLSSVRGGTYVRSCGLYDINKNFIQISAVVGKENVSGSITTTNNTYYIRVVSGTNYYDNCQVIRDTQAHSYIPYGKYGLEVKTTGKNLFDGVLEQGTVNSQGINNTNTTRLRTKNYIPVYPNTTYALKVNENTTEKNLQFSISYYDKNDYTTYRLSYLNWTTSNPITFTTPNNCHYIRFLIAYTDNSTINTTDNISKIQVEKTQATTYEPYKSNTYLYTLNQPLRSIGDTKDLLYIKNGMLYVERKIGSVVLNGSETWNSQTGTHTKVFNLYTSMSGWNAVQSKTEVKCEIATYSVNAGANNDTTTNICAPNSTGTNFLLDLSQEDFTSTNAFETWLSTHNTEVQYILASSNTEGVGKIEVPSTYKTITHINTTDELQPNMNITYVMNTQITNYVQNQVSQIKITEDGILAEVNRKVDNEEIIAKLNLAIEDGQGIINLIGNQVTIDSDYFELNADGTIKSTGGTIGGYKITDNMLYAETFAKYNYTENDLDKIRNYLMGTGTLTPEEFIKYDVDESGTVTSLDYITIKFFIEYNVTPTSSAKIIMQTGNSISDNAYVLQDGTGNEILNIGFNGIYYKDFNITDKRYVGESIRLTLSAEQTVSRATTTKVTVDTVDYNTSTMLTYSSNSVVIGKNVSSVLVNCRYTAFGANSSARYIYIYKNGSVFAFNNRSYSQTMETTAVVPVTEGDYIEMYCYQEQTGSITISNTSNQTFLQVTILG